VSNTRLGDEAAREEPLDPSGESANRDSAATGRDHISAERDAAARHRDVEAASRDQLSTDLDASTGHVDVNAASDRLASDEDRESAAGDRQHAAEDRQAAALDRSLAATYSDSLLHDLLTGLYRRQGGLRELRRDIAKARRTLEPFVLVFIDVDGLKAANASGGHAAGDRLLVRVAEAVRSCVREYDIVLRYGGDEFLCGLVGMDLPGVKARFGHLNPALAAAGGGSASVGVVQWKEGEDLASLIARADTAMYEQKALSASAASEATRLHLAAAP
jgi:diguanylate cyclase (GGDEF)-like protein